MAEHTSCGEVRYKHTPRSDELKRDVSRRINRAIGQLNGIRQMVDDDRYCGDVLTQLAAVESAVSAVSRIIMREHPAMCTLSVEDNGECSENISGGGIGLENMQDRVRSLGGVLNITPSKSGFKIFVSIMKNRNE